MKVRKKYHYGTDATGNLSTAQLLRVGSESNRGQIESLECAVEYLTRVVARIIDRHGLSDSEVLELTECDNLFEQA